MDHVPTPRPEPIEVHGERVRRSLGDYLDLVHRYVSGELDGPSFETAFFALNGRDPYLRPEPVHAVMEGFFQAVEDYVADPALRTEPEDLDDDQLRARARQLLADLDQLL